MNPWKNSKVDPTTLMSSRGIVITGERLIKYVSHPGKWVIHEKFGRGKPPHTAYNRHGREKLSAEWVPTYAIFSLPMTNKRFPHLEDGIHVSIGPYQDHAIMLDCNATVPDKRRRQLGLTRLYTPEGDRVTERNKHNWRFTNDPWRAAWAKAEEWLATVEQNISDIMEFGRMNSDPPIPDHAVLRSETDYPDGFPVEYRNMWLSMPARAFINESHAKFWFSLAYGRETEKFFVDSDENDKDIIYWFGWVGKSETPKVLPSELIAKEQENE